MTFRVNETECKFETECDLCIRRFDLEAQRSDCIETVMEEAGWIIVEAVAGEGFTYHDKVFQLCPDCVEAVKVKVGK